MRIRRRTSNEGLAARYGCIITMSFTGSECRGHAVHNQQHCSEKQRSHYRIQLLSHGAAQPLAECYS